MRTLPALRALPLLACIAILSLAARPSTPRPPAPPASVHFPMLCDQYSFVSGGDASFGFGVPGGVVQPLPAATVVTACSVHVQATGWSNLLAHMKDWDPTTLAPDPHTVALRTLVLDPSDLLYYTENRMQASSIVPPAISVSVPGVAEPPHATTALEVRSEWAFTPGFSGYYDPQGSTSLPAARAIQADGSYAPLTGAHPVLAQGLCFGDAATQALRVAQAVSRTDELLPRLTLQMVQRFTVPQLFWLSWAEVAGAPSDGFGYYWNAGKLAILDLSGGAPPVTLPAPITSAYFPRNRVYTRGWAASYELTSGGAGIVLVPGHEYALLVDRSVADIPVSELYSQLDLYTRTLTGTEPPGFQASIGALYTRTSLGAAWTQESGRVLSFKLVGTPIVPLEGPPVERQGFFLSVAPNPSHGDAAFAWSGAVGTVRGEVLDARGRRVASFEGGAAGRWMWRAAGRDGRPLAAGVYFVRARDSQGARVNQRLVITH